MAEVNQRLRAARQAMSSPASPAFVLSRSELAELAGAAIYRHTGRVAALDGHYVAKLERGAIRWPGSDYRRALREVLGAAADSELGFRPPRRGAATAPPRTSTVLAGNETERERLADVLAGRCRVDKTIVTHLAEVATAQRHIEETIGSSRVLPATLAEIELVEHLIRQACGEVWSSLVALLAEHHQLAGWMSEDSGDSHAALRHIDRGMQAAQEIDGANLVASMFGLRSHLAWGSGDAVGVVDMAQAGQRDSHRLSPAVLGCLAQMQARGHALHSQGAVADQLIDTTEGLTDQAHTHPEDEPWWMYFQTPERVLFQRGVAYVDLGRHQEAGDLLEKAQATLPASYRRDHGRWAARLALSRANDGDPAGALTAGLQALSIALDTGSAYTIADLRRMRRILDRQQP
ncbi:MAG TPA: hypothetical protein VGJ13_16910, partial [Pseudonocardiaceae bacterium]